MEIQLTQKVSKYNNPSEMPPNIRYTGVPVTDIKHYDEAFKTWKIGYYMSLNLAINLNHILRYLKNDFDVVGIISGRGGVRVGKSVMAQQIAYYISWLLAGGEMNYIEVIDSPYKEYRVTKPPTRKVHFSVKDNIVFTPDELITKADKLHKLYGSSVIIYDEGRTGLDSANVMQSLNKMMTTFFQECGQYRHVILIVLPDFFKLHPDYAMLRSRFLVDVFLKEEFERGYFAFYNKNQKELLYKNGKNKAMLESAKYLTIKPSFIGKFTKFSPIDEEEYREAKRIALKKKSVTRYEVHWHRRYSTAVFLLYKHLEWDAQRIADELTIVTGERISKFAVDNAIKSITRKADIDSFYGSNI